MKETEAKEPENVFEEIKKDIVAGNLDVATEKIKNANFSLGQKREILGEIHGSLYPKDHAGKAEQITEITMIVMGIE